MAKLERAADRTEAEERKPLLVGIAGGTGSGKTFLAHSMVSAMGKRQVALLQQDAYYRDLADKMSREQKVEARRIERGLVSWLGVVVGEALEDPEGLFDPEVQS